MMPSLLPALLALAALAGEGASISVPTGKETPITPAKVTPRPTYRPPTGNPAPVVEYSLDNPEPEPLDPSWAFVPVKYLNVLSANSIRYVPMTIRNPYPYLYSANGDAVDQVYDYNFGAKVLKDKYKPRYYHPKFAQKYKVPTKGGYPKKASSDMKYYYYYQKQNLQPLQQEPQQLVQMVPEHQVQQQMQVSQQQIQVPQQQIQVPQQQIQVSQEQYQQELQQQQQQQQQQQIDQAQSQ